MKRVPGHELLARLGKKRLRPGGVEATNWLLEKGEFSTEKNVLEVACNMGTTLLEIANKYGCTITGVDMSDEALEKAKRNVKNANLEDKINLLKADAKSLPFEDETFDIVINEAMLTMLSNKDKEKALREYYRVLKKGGVLLTHDINVVGGVPKVLSILRKVIHVPAVPLKESDWITLLEKVGFINIKDKTGEMTLMSDEGMIKDEGEEGMKQIHENASKDSNYEQFYQMKEFFEKYKDKLYYIVFCSRK
ncbi:MAG: SAM-dependent methyltransferase [Clostridiales bacterium]|nr:MAG: SAM-dependent methyltransferase [Clostridiales bacterium]